MKNKNICKFITDSTPEKLETYCFIYESDADVMKTPSVLNHHRAILVTQGKGKFKFNNEEVLFCAGSLIFGFENEMFSVSFSEPCEYMYINFGGTRSEALFHRFGINRSNRSFDKLDILIPVWRDSLSRASQTNIDLASEGILLYTFSRLNSISDKQNNLISEIVKISEEQFSDPELSLSSIAEELGYNSKYISHFFKEKMGMGYSEYLRTLRIKHAIFLFDHGIDSVKNVAFLSGFSDPLYFSSVFKRVTGTSPKEYKNRSPKV